MDRSDRHLASAVSLIACIWSGLKHPMRDNPTPTRWVFLLAGVLLAATLCAMIAAALIVLGIL